jgi:hypothetical protein
MIDLFGLANGRYFTLKKKPGGAGLSGDAANRQSLIST